MPISKDHESNPFDIGTDGSVSLDGFPIPHIKVKQQFSGGFSILLDGRFGIDAASSEELQRWLWFMSHGMAVAAGFTAFGRNSAVRNNYGPSISNGR